MSTNRNPNGGQLNIWMANASSHWRRMAAASWIHSNTCIVLYSARRRMRMEFMAHNFIERVPRSTSEDHNVLERRTKMTFFEYFCFVYEQTNKQIAQCVSQIRLNLDQNSIYYLNEKNRISAQDGKRKETARVTNEAPPNLVIVLESVCLCAAHEKGWQRWRAKDGKRTRMPSMTFRTQIQMRTFTAHKRNVISLYYAISSFSVSVPSSQTPTISISFLRHTTKFIDSIERFESPLFNILLLHAIDTTEYTNFPFVLLAFPMLRSFPFHTPKRIAAALSYFRRHWRSHRQHSHSHTHSHIRIVLATKFHLRIVVRALSLALCWHWRTFSIRLAWITDAPFRSVVVHCN